MPAKKRSSDEVDASENVPATKVAKTTKDTSETTKTRKGPKATLAPTAFKSKALPLHMNLTHTPSVIISSDDTSPSASADPGFIGSATLLPTIFSTGSYGWKGNKKVTIELQNSESGKKEKVQVNISINATVMGSKHAKEGDPDDNEADKSDDHDEDDKNDK